MKRLKEFKESGQTLIFVLLVMTIALAVGISIPTRTISGVRRTTNIDSSVRAQAAAEAAIEYYLSRPVSELNGIIGNSDVYDCSATGARTYPPGGGSLTSSQDQIRATADVVISRYGCLGYNTLSDPYELPRDGMLEIKLDPRMLGDSTSSTLGSSQSIRICWDLPPTGYNPAIYYHYIFGPPPHYLIQKMGWRYNSTDEGENFKVATNYGAPDGYCATQELTTSTSGWLPRVLRITSLYNSSTVRVKMINSGGRLPYQGFIISATGIVGESQQGARRVIEARRSLPQLPVLFNFGLYSGSQTAPVQ